MFSFASKKLIAFAGLCPPMRLGGRAVVKRVNKWAWQYSHMSSCMEPPLAPAKALRSDSVFVSVVFSSGTSLPGKNLKERFFEVLIE